ncbi:MULTISPECIES: mechanosensitive ion channel domain-containing protein [unclassified Pseudovibrio]|uniref:mechanosensitive ion channel domain-containing protein n=1 Tax=unclassified Pseudovibrio TaxID=2627060 RepID=UPI0007AEC6A6|nr:MULTISPECIES: mechanosensitive ion channel domain-containing protein [unclassified Pseudovibrio]KZL03979.1 Moderate conductance mechanosensitive channel YbiO precursor [Pseudovibrio sp. W74]KZL04198.1 Moderate conductance mechanosensitive channel YbiO precursor [Pseudovibrio sp. Ad14]
MLFRFLIAAFAAVFLSFASSAQAQNSSTSAEGGADVQQAKQALIKVLEDPKGREALVKILQEQQANGSSGSGASTATANPAAKATIAAQIGTYVQDGVSSFYDFGTLIISGLSGYEDLLDGQSKVDHSRLWDGIFSIIRVLLPAYLILIILHKASTAYMRRHEKGPEAHSLFFRVGLLAVTSVFDAAFVGIASGVGYLSAYIFSTDPTVQSINNVELFAINAFFLIEMSRVVIRFVFAPHRPSFRLLPFSDPEAVFWARHLILIVGILGFGVRLAVPMVGVNFSSQLAGSVRVTVVLVCLIYLVAIILRSRLRVRHAIRKYAESFTGANFSVQLFKGLGFVWHLLALLYVFAIMVAWLRTPLDAINYIARTSAMSLLVIFIGLGIMMLLTRVIRKGVDLHDALDHVLPTFEKRLNSFLPTVCMVLRVIVGLCVIIGVLEVWGVGNFWQWIWAGDGISFANSLMSAVIVILIGFALWLTIMSWIDLRILEREGKTVSSRTKTLFQLFSNALSILMIVMFTLLALSELGIQIAPLIAGAGVVGLAVSFGSQKLVQDVITGAFIQLENAMNEGDFVEVGGISGTVERLSIRSVRLRDLNGTSHIIPFSSVTSVSNSTRDFAYAVSVMGVGYDTDIEVAKEAMQEAFRRLEETPHNVAILGELEMHGVTAFGDSAINIRARIKTLPGSQWAIGRAYNEYLKVVFDERGIDIPFPQVTYHVAGDSKPEEVPQVEQKAALAKGRGSKAAGSEGDNTSEEDGQN